MRSSSFARLTAVAIALAISASSAFAGGNRERRNLDLIEAEILGLSKRFRIRELAFDRWHAEALEARLQGHGLTLAKFGQGFASMSAPTKDLEVQVVGGHFRHGAHPVLRWMADNLEVRTDPAGNVKPVKPEHKHSHRKIDGMVAQIMALARLNAALGDGGGVSVYQNQSLLSVRFS